MRGGRLTSGVEVARQPVQERVAHQLREEQAQRERQHTLCTEVRSGQVRWYRAMIPEPCTGQHTMSAWDRSAGTDRRVQGSCARVNQPNTVGGHVKHGERSCRINNLHSQNTINVYVIATNSLNNIPTCATPFTLWTLIPNQSHS